MTRPLRRRSLRFCVRAAAVRRPLHRLWDLQFRCLGFLECRRNVFFTAEEYRQVLGKYLEQQDTKREDGEEQATQTGGPPPGGRGNAVKIDPLLAEAGTYGERGRAFR